MNTSILGIWYLVGDLGVPKLAAQESAALIILAASLVVFRTFRERYLLVWILGWVAYFLSRWTPGTSAAERLTSDLIAIRQVEFILAVCLFAGAVFVYTHARKFVRPLVVIAVVLMAFAAVEALYWPDVFILRAALEIAYRLVALAASFELIRYRWGRGEIGPWLMAGGLLLVHLDWASLGAIMAPSLGLMADLILGLSMLLIVLDDSRIRSRRLAVVNAVTSTISRSRQQAPMMTTALEELKILFRAKAAWFRLLEGESLVMSQQIGLSAEFLEDRNLIPIDKTIEPVLRDGVAVVVRTAEATECVQPYLEQERFHHVVMVPVVGKKSPIGMLTLGSRRRFSYAPDDMEFLANSAHQLGLGVENLRLVEQILRSHRQWANTFDSIQDLVLVHDAAFVVMKANMALLQRLGQAPADVIGQPCDSVLPRKGEWTGCPYCVAAEE